MIKSSWSSILGNVEEVMALQRRRRGSQCIPRRRGLFLVAAPPKMSHTACHCVGWYTVVCYDAPVLRALLGSLSQGGGPMLVLLKGKGAHDIVIAECN